MVREVNADDAGGRRAATGGRAESLRGLIARKAAELIRSDPDEAATALELGLIDHRWLEDPANRPISTSKPTEILEHFLARSVERRPSLLSSMGLSAVQLLAAHRAPAGGNPQVVTVVFTDLEGFTSYTDANGDEAALALIEAHHRAASPVVRRWGGRVVKHLGDGLLCTFSDPAGAMRAALALLDASPAPLRLRAGLHVGEAIVSRDDVVGHVVNVAARVTETAKGNQVVATGESVDAAGALSEVRTKKLRSRRLKGITGRVELYEVVAR